MGSLERIEEGLEIERVRVFDDSMATGGEIEEECGFVSIDSDRGIFSK